MVRRSSSRAAAFPWNRRIGAALLLALPVVACSLTDLDGLAVEAPGAAAEGGTDAFAAPDATNQGSPDAAADADAVAPAQPCTPGATRSPVGVVEYPSGLAAGSTCALSSMLVVDGKTGALDRLPGAPEPPTDGRNVTSCALFDFGIEQSIASVVVTARAAGNGCGVSACVTSGDMGCGTGRFAAIFLGNDAKTFVHLDDFDVTDTLQASARATPVGSSRYVLVCRTAAGTSRDDIEIDGVTVTCR